MDTESLRTEFDALMRAHGAMIYTLAVRLTGQTAAGQDLAQDTFVKAFKHFAQFRGDSDARTWLYRICVNTWKNRVRYEKRRFFWQHFSLDGKNRYDEPLGENLAAPETSLGGSIEQTDQTQKLQQALNQLPEQDKVILVLRDMEERSYEEISAFLDVPLGTVKSRLARGRERLRQLLTTTSKETL